VVATTSGEAIIGLALVSDTLARERGAIRRGRTFARTMLDLIAGGGAWALAREALGHGQGILEREGADPVYFTKAPESVVGRGADVIHHTMTGELDHEVELTAVIGTAGRDIARADALRHVFGYTIVNDVTARDLQKRHGQCSRASRSTRSVRWGRCW
jgi:2-keto-4-pentenoate hydratase/2-oxohepta-3-ene-1,7-dioic acid hydratase in catechol pathway